MRKDLNSVISEAATTTPPLVPCPVGSATQKHMPWQKNGIYDLIFLCLGVALGIFIWISWNLLDTILPGELQAHDYTRWFQKDLLGSLRQGLKLTYGRE
jgi:hypothetical protein